MENQNDNRNQIIRIDARASFVETRNDCFHLGKVHLQFVAYDKNRPSGQRATSIINIYIDVPQFLVLAQEAANGSLHMRMQQYVGWIRFLNGWAALLPSGWPSMVKLDLMA